MAKQEIEQVLSLFGSLPQVRQDFGWMKPSSGSRANQRSSHTWSCATNHPTKVNRVKSIPGMSYHELSKPTTASHIHSKIYKQYYNLSCMTCEIMKLIKKTFWGIIKWPNLHHIKVNNFNLSKKAKCHTYVWFRIMYYALKSDDY